MSLLILNSSSKIAQGLLKHFYNNGKFEKIICADLYPNYQSIKVTFLNSSGILWSQTLITSQQNSYLRLQILNQTRPPRTNFKILPCFTHHSRLLRKRNSETECIKNQCHYFKRTKSNFLIYKLKSFMSVNPVEHRHQYDPESQEIDLK
jgi:hypothetical protein